MSWILTGWRLTVKIVDLETKMWMLNYMKILTSSPAEEGLLALVENKPHEADAAASRTPVPCSRPLSRVPLVQEEKKRAL